MNSNRGRNLVLALVIIGLLALTFYRLLSVGKLPFNFNLSSPPPARDNQTRVVVSEENAVISAVEKTSPSVVAIGVTQTIVSPFNPFLGPSRPRTEQNTIGTGFLVASNIVITNRHVVSDASQNYTVVTKDGKKLAVEKIYRDPFLDLALVTVSNSGLQPLELGDSSKLKVGQTAIAIGNALGRFDNTVTTGVVSGIGRTVSAGDPFSGTTETLDNLIQTDAAINPGNSGGPLLNSAGQVIGVNVATTQGAQNIGFAIPINSVKKILNEYETTGTVSHPFLGIRYVLLTTDQAMLYQLPPGAYIQDVVNGSPAAKAGLQTGEVITKIDNQPVNVDNKVSSIISSKKVGDGISMEVWSNGQTRTVSVTLGQAPGQ